MTIMTIGLIVNPIAGMGGSVGLKGTDGEMYRQSLALGAKPVAPNRVATMLAALRQPERVAWLAAPGAMGSHALASQDIPHETVGDVVGETTAEDTRRIARAMIEAGAKLLVLVGGDGTARDVYDAIETRAPVVAVPAGVKVYSGVFALNPRAAAELVDAFVTGAGVTEQEVLDIDEAAYREDRLAAQLYGYLLVPDAPRYIQGGKQASSTAPTIEENKRDIAASIIESMDAETLYLLGPGTTIKAIAEALDVPKTLLGVDAVCGGELIGADINEQAILALLEAYPRRAIVVTPLGGNGFIFGRGNKQFTPEVLRQVGRERILVVGAAEKVQSLPCLRVDTGAPDTDALLTGYIEVTTNYRQARVIRVT